MTECARGCLSRGRHRTDCSGGKFEFVKPPDSLFNADRPHENRHKYWIRYGGIETWQDCPGCLPRQAHNGALCEPCHNRIAGWLGGQRGLVWAYGWLGENLPRGGTSAARQDWQRPGGKDGPPLPIREAVHDLRVLLSDRVFIAEERVREEFDRPTRDLFNLALACNFLAAWLTKIEENGALVVWMWDKFDEVMRDLSNTVPWSDRPRLISGVACPHCETESLARYPGEEDITCRNCWAMIPKERYEIWTRMLAGEVAS
jgi:hypothetical protein